MKRAISIVASLVLAGSLSMTAYADDMLEKDYIVSEIWSDWWLGRDDDGLIFPEASYKHHILTDWVEDNYGDDNYDWSEIGQLNYDFKDYYDDLTQDWSFHDDNSGNWTIETSETIYHFNLQGGKWLMSDSNGNVIDSFMPFSTIEEGENSSLAIPDDNAENQRVGVNLKIDDEPDTAESTTEAIEEKAESKQSSNGLIYAIGGILLVGVGVLAGILMKKKRG